MKMRALPAVGLAILAMAACARSETAHDAADSVAETALRNDEDQAADRARRETSMREAGERGRAAGKREIERSAASEAKRLADQ
jgi:hypothetical protein